MTYIRIKMDALPLEKQSRLFQFIIMEGYDKYSDLQL